MRGVGEDGQDLVISRDYIREGMRAAAREIVTRELGPRTDLDIRRSMERQVEAERWTEIDRTCRAPCSEAVSSTWRPSPACSQTATMC